MDSKKRIGNFQFTARVPTLNSLKDNPFVPPSHGRCLINELPPELLSHIFLMGTAGFAFDDLNEFEDDSEFGEESDEDDRREPEFEVLVSHVCRQWRQLAITTSTLWTTIDFEERPPYLKSKMYLERSNISPLEISMDVCPDINPEASSEQIALFSERIKAMLELVLPHVSHWRSVQVAVSLYEFMHMALVAMGSCPAAPMLESLQLYHYEDGDAYEHFEPPQFKDQDFILFHGNAPRLTHVVLWGVHINWHESRFLSGLIELELAYHTRDVRPDYKDFARILHESPKIDTLSICQSGPADGPAEWLHSIIEPPPEDLVRQTIGTATPSSSKYTPPLTMLFVPSLKNLVIAFVEPANAVGLIRRLAMPHLKSLAFDFEDIDYGGIVRALTQPSPANSRPVFAGIEALKVSGIPCENPTTIRDAYATMDQLTSLNLNFAFISKKWYAVLRQQWRETALKKRPPLLPRLEALTTSGLGGKTMRRLLAARKATGKPIKRVFMNEEDNLKSEDEAWIKRNVESFEYFEGSDEEYEEDEVVEIDMEGVDSTDDEDEDEGEEEEENNDGDDNGGEGQERDEMEGNDEEDWEDVD